MTLESGKISEGFWSILKKIVAKKKLLILHLIVGFINVNTCYFFMSFLFQRQQQAFQESQLEAETIN